MIIEDLFNLVLIMFESLSYNDFVLTFSYIAILVLIIKALKSFLWSFS